MGARADAVSLVGVLGDLRILGDAAAHTGRVLGGRGD